MACLFWQAAIGSRIQCCSHDVRLQQRRGVVALARKKDDVVWKEVKQEILLDKADLMQLKFFRLLGESRELSLAKVVAKKLNPHLNNLEVHKLVKKSGVNGFIGMISETAKQSADYDVVEEAIAAPEAPEAASIHAKEDGLITLAPKPMSLKAASASSQEKQQEASIISRDRFVELLDDREKVENELPRMIGSSEEFTSLAAAARSEWMERAEISIEKFIRLLDESGKDFDAEKVEVDQRAPRSAKKFDRRPRSSDTVGRRRKSKTLTKPFTSSASANRKISKLKGKSNKP